MRRRLATVGSVLLGAAVACVPSPGADRGPGAAAGHLDTSVEAALREIRPEGIRAHMEFLADDLLEGRMPGTAGYDIAARYVASRFRALGLRPAGADGSYFQPVPLVAATVEPSGTSVIIQGPGGVQVLTPGEEYVAAPNFFADRSAVTAPVTFAGFGVSAPELGHDDYAGLDVRGKVVAVLRGAPATFPSDLRAHHGVRKAAVAAARGAVGLITILTPEAERRYAWQWIVAQASRPRMRWLDGEGRPADAHAEIRGAALLSRAGAEVLFADAPRPLQEVLEAAEEGAAPAFDLPVEVTIRTATRRRHLDSVNVAAVLDGSDPELRREYVAYTAHLDHVGVGPPVEGDPIYNGAYDNASGTAILLETARGVARMPRPPRRSIVFLAVTAEEAGLLGSDYYARNPTVPAEAIVANINMDLVLILHPLEDVIAFGAAHSSLARTVREAASALEIRVSPDPIPEENVFVRSDQYSFVRQGVPAVMLFPGFASRDPAVDGAALFRRWMATRYHTPQDDLGQPIDFEESARFGRLNLLVGLLVANADARPSWNPGDFFGETFGRRGPERRRPRPGAAHGP